MQRFAITKIPMYEMAYPAVDMHTDAAITQACQLLQKWRAPLPVPIKNNLITLRHNTKLAFKLKNVKFFNHLSFSPTIRF